MPAKNASVLGFSQGVGWDELVGYVTQTTRKNVRIQAIGDAHWRNATAALSRFPDQDLILIRYTDSPLYRTHSILHEFGHLLLGHDGCTQSKDTVRDDAHEQAAELLAYQLAQRLYRPGDYEDLRVLG
ncbi:ImmA/IrrE family metallo-endopeptidase [Gryllotalpicola reticulitermitis]|uniref:ImmA/IrrE family metallo-endopeptidase n=1 Tax=Gryllotalpicola reticulitermitis TaxID=1184153 RepID=A0ABV8Q9H0_9MICO